MSYSPQMFDWDCSPLASLQARHHFLGNTRHLFHIGPGWPEHDGLDSGVEEAMDPGGADLRGAKGTVGIDVKLRAVIGVGKGPELLPTALAVRADANVMWPFVLCGPSALSS